MSERTNWYVGENKRLRAENEALREAGESLYELLEAEGYTGTTSLAHWREVVGGKKPWADIEQLEREAGWC